jgi:hypothetical protein
VGKGNIEVGKKTATRNLARLIVEGLAGNDGRSEPQTAQTNPPPKTRPGISGAMAQQNCDSGNQSSPQKLLQLVGCREPKVRPQPWVRPRPAPVKR